MELLKYIRTVMLSAGCMGIVLPTSVAGAANPLPSGRAAVSTLSQVAVTDLALGKNGTMQGLVVDAQGVPLQGAPIVVQQAGREIARVASDPRGYFQVQGLRGGVYQISTAHGGGAFRLWAPGTAPPAAKAGVIIVSGEHVVRGQRPLGDYFASDRFILMSLIGTAVAIPVVIFNNRSKPPGS